jgi:hypothetical protein
MQRPDISLKLLSNKTLFIKKISIIISGFEKLLTNGPERVNYEQCVVRPRQQKGRWPGAWR